MFPEGTRTTPGAPLDFHRGAASVAVRAARVVTPVFIWVDPTTLTKEEPWYRIPFRRPHFTLVVGDDLDPSTFVVGTSLPIAARALNAHLLELFSGALEAGPARAKDTAVLHETGIIRDSLSGKTG
jgi:1-acyl-sn-glycerol-3-phosphate acyltransferase